MRFTAHVTHEDGRNETALIRVADIADFEDTFNMAATRLEAEPRFSWMLWLAWRALRRADSTIPDYDAWRATVADLDIDTTEAEAEERPTSPVS